MKDDLIYIHGIGDAEYVLSPFAAKKLRESLMLAISLTDPGVETPLHPNAKRKRYW